MKKFFSRCCFVAISAILCTAAYEVDAATLSLTPDTGVYTTGGTFSARVIINTEGAPVNAAEGRLTFDASTLSVVNISRSNSIFNLWTQDPSFSNTAGTIDFGGGATPPGYTGRAGTIMTVTFRAKTAGTAKVSFSNGSVLAADGRGTNVLRSMNGGAFTVSAVDTTPQAEQIIEYVTPPNTPENAYAPHWSPCKWSAADRLIRSVPSRPVPHPPAA